jgi:hypothetical protein
MIIRASISLIDMEALANEFLVLLISSFLLVSV